MTIKNRLVILSAILWIIFFGIFTISRYSSEELIAQAVEATMQAHPTDSINVQEAAFLQTTATPDFNMIPETPAPVSTPAGNSQNDSPNQCFYARLVTETIPDRTLMKPGQPFTKTWILENTGSCAWAQNYQLIFTGGEQMNAPSSIPIGQMVNSGDHLTISVGFIAPPFTGSARGNWMLETDQGARFARIWVQIDVQE